MSWGEVKIINSDLSTPLNVLEQARILTDFFRQESVDMVFNECSDLGKVMAVAFNLSHSTMDSLTTLSAIVTSSSAMALVVGVDQLISELVYSSAGIAALVGSDTAIAALITDTSAFTLACESVDFITALAGDSSAMAVVVTNSGALDILGASSTAMTIIAASSTAMTVIAGSGLALNRLVKQSIARAKMISNYTVFNALKTTILATLEAATSYFTKTVTDASSVSGTAYYTLGTTSSFTYVDYTTDSLNANGLYKWNTLVHGSDLVTSLGITFAVSGNTTVQKICIGGARLGVYDSSACGAGMDYYSDVYAAI